MAGNRHVSAVVTVTAVVAVVTLNAVVVAVAVVTVTVTVAVTAAAAEAIMVSNRYSHDVFDTSSHFLWIRLAEAASTHLSHRCHDQQSTNSYK